MKLGRKYYRVDVGCRSCNISNSDADIIYLRSPTNLGDVNDHDQTAEELHCSKRIINCQYEKYLVDALLDACRSKIVDIRKRLECKQKIFML